MSITLQAACMAPGLYDATAAVEAPVKLEGRRNVSTVQPEWACGPCGATYGDGHGRLATWHDGTCGVCGKQASVTGPRKFGFLAPGWESVRAVDNATTEG